MSKSKEGKGDGLFAVRNFQKGDLVSYFNCVKTTEAKMFENSEDMNSEELEAVGAYYYGLGEYSPEILKIPKDMELDIPKEYRSVNAYRTTLGHKVNHKFVNVNTIFDYVVHPIFDNIVCLIAVLDIQAEEEIFVSYNYGLDVAPEWYKKLYNEEDYSGEE